LNRKGSSQDIVELLDTEVMVRTRKVLKEDTHDTFCNKQGKF